VAEPRYRCDACGNLTRFDVTTSQTTKAFHHYSVGGELRVEEATVLAHHVDAVVCRWCGHGRNVVELSESELRDAGDAGQDGGSPEPGTPSRVS
jgi:hypothetical protein